MSLSDDLVAAEHAYRTAVMELVAQADDVEPLARMAEHLADMTAAMRAATLAAMERVDLFGSVAATSYICWRRAKRLQDTPPKTCSTRPDPTNRPRAPPRDVPNERRKL